MDRLLELHKIKHITHASQNHAGAGTVEAKCKLIASTLRRMMEGQQQLWLEKLTEACLAINSAAGSISGVSAFEAFTGRPAVNRVTLSLPDQKLVHELVDSLEKRQARAQIACDLTNARNAEQAARNDKNFKCDRSKAPFEVGERVLLFTEGIGRRGKVSKISNSYREVIVTEVLPHNQYRVREMNGKTVPIFFHANRMRSIVTAGKVSKSS